MSGENGLAAIVIWLVLGAIIFRFLSLFILNKDFNPKMTEEQCTHIGPLGYIRKLRVLENRGIGL